MTEKVRLYMGSRYYPNGGHEDYQGTFDNFCQARDHVDELLKQDEFTMPWWHIVDCLSNVVIEGLTREGRKFSGEFP